jgi:hypothetical protein
MYTLCLSLKFWIQSRTRNFCAMSEISFSCCFYRAFLLVLVKPNVLQSLLDIKAVIPLFIQMLSPFCYEFLLCVFRLGSDLHYSVAKKLGHTVFEWLFTGVPCPNRDKAFNQRLQVSCFRAPNIGCFSFYFVDWIICAKATVGKRAISDINSVKEGCGRRCRKGSFAYCGSNIRLVG